MTYRVAICQESIIPGGRLRVILGIVEILNEMGITPDILTYRLNIKKEQIEDLYEKRLSFRFRQLPYVLLPNDFSIIVFNADLKYTASNYDLLINTSNSLLFLPENGNVLSYVFYPRESRIKSKTYSIHNPEKIIPPYSPAYFTRKLLQRIYRARHLSPHHRIIAMTQFTRAALEEEYPALTTSHVPVIYPPVEIENIQQKTSGAERKDIVSIGRFVTDKRQLEQIKLAKHIPELSFHIIGFVGNKNYYRKCERLVKEMKLDNIYLHPNASHSKMTDILNRSRYFIHTLINEPFGITAVQAVAAGCLPLVHASGGQREVIPYPELQYKKLEEIPELILKLERLSNEAFDDLYISLYQHVSQSYNETVFNEKMRTVLRETLPS
jgi:glycosyltransferase involved in cell wall biosynthesis